MISSPERDQSEPVAGEPPFDITLVACSATKQAGAVRADELYKSNLFAGSRILAERASRSWFIISAKYGLVRPAAVIQSYDSSLDQMSLGERAQWATRVVEALPLSGLLAPRILLLAGEVYAAPLRPLLEARGARIIEPLRGMGIGSRISFLRRAVSDFDRMLRLSQLYEAIERLGYGRGQGKRLGDLSASDVWAERGVYIFVDDSEGHRWDMMMPRIVRVGTHGVSVGSKSTLWQRLRTHRGGEDLFGSHRSSVFRRHVGAAILKRTSKTHRSWGVGDSASRTVRSREASLERAVSEYLRNLRVYFIAVGDSPSANSDRSYIERSLVALLSNHLHPLDPPGRKWLGAHADRVEIQKSGLWNVDYVGESEQKDWLYSFESFVDRTLRGEKISESIAPAGWRETARTREVNQPDLFVQLEPPTAQTPG